MLAVSGAVTLTALPAEGGPVGSVRKVTAIGDSYPKGSGGNERRAYPELYGSRTGQPTLNRSFPGWMTGDVLYNMRSDGSVLRNIRDTRTVIVTVGANDISMRYPNPSTAAVSTRSYQPGMRSMRANLHTILGSVSRARGGNTTRVVVTGYNNIYMDGAALSRQSAAYRKGSVNLTNQVNSIIMAECAAYRMKCVNPAPAFHARGVNTTALVTADGTHPSAAGHRLYANLVYNKVR
ncbi:hypothetical protein GCM10009599_05020 [Luteococcus peritonei]